MVCPPGEHWADYPAQADRMAVGHPHMRGTHTQAPEEGEHTMAVERPTAGQGAGPTEDIPPQVLVVVAPTEVVPPREAVDPRGAVPHADQAVPTGVVPPERAGPTGFDPRVAHAENHS
jgi:hypothetical protein